MSPDKQRKKIINFLLTWLPAWGVERLVLFPNIDLLKITKAGFFWVLNRSCKEKDFINARREILVLSLQNKNKDNKLN